MSIVTGGFPYAIVTQGYGEEYTSGIEPGTAIRVGMDDFALTLGIEWAGVTVVCGGPGISLGLEQASNLNISVERV